ncbi:MAG: sodium:solute symporter family protein [Proteobacteria bacterium]|jgi:SSS family solute:Na+ symporter|nr:sodium:solute symporter family protein [Gemmatimonadales bacterium]NCG33049.1 sodium:solute symporter family protein [Pseudomonadota bacterium]
MEQWVVVTIIIVLYLALTLTIGLMAGRNQTDSVAGYVAADRSFGLLVMYFVTGASVFSAFAFLGGPGWAYSRGAAAFYILAYGALGMAPFYWMGPRAALLGRKFGYVTQAQLVTGRFPSKRLSAMIAVLSLVAFVPYVTLQMRGAGIVIEAVTDGHVPLWLGSFVAYGIVILYVLRSGAMAVGWTNTFQGVFMVIIAWSLGLYLPHRLYGGIGPMFEQIAVARPELLVPPGLTAAGDPWSWGAFSTFILVSAIGLMMWPHLFMKAFTAKDDDTLRRTVILFPTFQLFLIPVFLIGFAGVMFAGQPASSDFILPFMILETDLPAVVVGLFCAGALSASMSTGDALLHASASVFVGDGVAKFMPLTEHQQRRLMQVIVLLTGAIAYYFAMDPESSLVQLLATAYGIISQLAPPVVAAMYWKRATTAGVITGLIAGTATAFFFYTNPELKPYDMHEGILALMVHVPVLVGASLMTQRQDEEHLKGFFS